MSVVDAPPPRETVPGPREHVGPGVPDPRIPLRDVAAPTALLFAGGLAVWGTATWLALTGTPAWVTVPLHTLVTFTMFTVLHESVHHAAGRLTWFNELLGRLAMPFVAAYGSFPLLRFVHLQHHRHTNDDNRADPDSWNTRGPWWQLPLRWLTVDLVYGRFYLSRAETRPHAEVTETVAVLALSAAATVSLVSNGFGWELLVIYLVPQRIGLALLSFWFVWLPHHDLPSSRVAGDRFATTRVRVGLEWLMTPLTQGQNYHLVHHLHPTVPFYRYLRAWHANQENYLGRRPHIATPWGRELSPAEYREWRRLGEPRAEDAPVTDAVPMTGDSARFHRLEITEIRELTEDAVAVSLTVPAPLSDTFRFIPGQHLTFRSTVDGHEARRNYSICCLPGSGTLRVAMKSADCHLFSPRESGELLPGDPIETLPPSGTFTLAARERGAEGKHYVALAGGIGVAPFLSMLPHVLLRERNSRATLLYVACNGPQAMFADELTGWARRFGGRLRVVHYRTDERDPALHSARTSRPLDTIGEALAISFEQYVGGRLDAARFRALLGGKLHPAKVDEWFVSGLPGAVDLAREILLEHDVPEELVHCALFTPDLGMTG